MAVILKRIYEPPSRTDGARVLVDRLWPRGLTKQDARLDAWLRELAPSNELRKWFHAHPLQWKRFREKYLQELSAESVQSVLQQLYQIRNQRSRLTLLFASQNVERNNAVVLKELLEGRRKPPTGTGPFRAAAPARARAGRRS